MAAPLDIPMRVINGIVSFFTGEFLLTKFKNANGGGVVAARAAWTSMWLYLGSIWVREIVDPQSTLRPSWPAFRVAIHETITLLGAIFVGAFTSFYTRFSQQWTYLANLYNQIKATQVRSAGNIEARAPLVQWKAGFIIDAMALHLARKDLFVTVIKNWYSEECRARNQLDARASRPGECNRRDRPTL